MKDQENWWRGLEAALGLETRIRCRKEAQHEFEVYKNVIAKNRVAAQQSGRRPGVADFKSALRICCGFNPQG